MRSIDVGVGPGVVSALLFIFLDIFTVGVLDMVLSRVVCLSYYRNINEGKPVSVKSADIPGLSNYLLGRWISPTNLIAIGAKLSLLIIVLTANMSIRSKSTVTHYEERTGAFKLAPSDEDIARYENKTNSVRPRLESSKSCFEEDGDTLTYYQLRFNLEDGNNGQKEINDSSMICMSTANVDNSQKLITVKGCTRKEIWELSCLTVISGEARKNARNLTRLEQTELYEGDIVHTFIEFAKEDVDQSWWEYKNPVLTCLSTHIGIDSTIAASKYTHCLMVSKEDDKTFIERWIMGPSSDNGREDPEGIFILEYPGIIFEGIHDFDRQAAARYLQLPFPFADYRTLSGELIAQASQFEEANGQIGILEKEENGNTVTTMDIYAVVLVAGAIVIVIVSYVVTIVLLRRDNRPRFNTINGLSSIVREEHIPSGRSYTAGESAILGLRFTSDDSLHFGPLRDRGEGTPFQDGYDIS